MAQPAEDAVQGCQQAAGIVLNGLGLPRHLMSGLIAHLAEARQVCCRLEEWVRRRLDRQLHGLKAVHRLFDRASQVGEFFIQFPILIAHQILHIGPDGAVADGPPRVSLEDLVHLVLQGPGREGFDDVIVDSCLRGFDDIVHLGFRRDHQNGERFNFSSARIARSISMPVITGMFQSETTNPWLSARS